MKKITRGMMDRLLEKQRHCCTRCGGWLFVDPDHPWHVDHILAIAKGGQHAEDNLQILHAKCNLIKGTGT